MDHRIRATNRDHGALAHALAGMVVAGSVVVAVQGATQTAPAATGIAAPAQEYNWRNVQVAGGGFVPGIVFNPTERDLIYARTDIGGAYRWNERTQRWIPLLDWVGWSNWGYNGVHSLATDPVQTNRVYAAVGMYTNGWDPNNGAILRSSNKGDTWQITPLPFKLGGNMPGRGMGERLAVDPNRNGTVYFGAPEGNGLWRSTDFGATWARVTSFPNAGNWAQDPGDPNGYLSHRPGVVWVTFDPRTGSSGSTTQTIYAGVADLNNTAYRSTNGGQTWERLAGAPTGFMAQKGVLDPVNGHLFIATSNNGGPYDGTNGQVWRYTTASGQWTNITPTPPLGNTAPYYGHSGLTVDRQRPGTIMVTGYSSWWPDTWIWRSTDSGTTWQKFYDVPAWPNRANRYIQDITSVPWLTLGASPPLPEVSPKLGWMTQALEIDPHNSNRFLYGTGATIYGSTNLTTFDSGGNPTIRPVVAGLEETAVLDLISPPSGAPLISGLGDIGGFRHTNLDAVPSTVFTAPVFTTTSSLDYAERNPSVLVRAGNFTDADRPTDSHVAFSTDGGANWFQGSEPGGINEGGTVAAAADGGRFVWAPRGQTPVFSVGFGNSWTQVQGLPAETAVESDRVNAGRFYGFTGGRFYVSTNGGQSFTATVRTGLPSSARFKAVPGREGDIWLAGDTGLFHSTDAGATFTRVSTVSSARNIGFGRAAPNQTYPALYAVATIDGVTGVFRSDNAGAAWVRINDDLHQYGNMGEAVTGDPRIYGRVYLGTNGRGILYADPTATQADPLRNHAGGRYIGYALNLTAQGGDAMYRTVGAREFNIVTAENAMKWDATEPSPNQFSFGQANEVVSTAQANNQQIHGHTLVWHSQTPGWVQGLGATQLREAMRNHIATVVGRYASSVRSWDVVNEAMNEDGSLRQSFWLNTLGQSYIADAFRSARAADPDAELCINDFNTDGMGAKSNGLFTLVQSLLRQGVPITCVGFQGHLAVQFGFPSQVRQNFQRFADLGLTVKITELDVRVQNPPDTTKFATQAGHFRQMVQACLDVGARCDQITFWGFTDKFTWVPGTFPNECCPLLYDQNYNPKPAYTAVHDALAG